MDIKVSIILPSLNVVDYIRECLDSVLAQTLREIEILCVDAGSIDGTLEILQKYEKIDPRIQIIQCEVKSYGKQVNEGILKAKGKYIAIVDTDDFIATEMYDKLYNLAEVYSLDYVKADYDAFAVLKNGGRVWRTNKTLPVDPGMYGRVLVPRHYFSIFKDYNIWKGIYLKDFLIKHHIELNESSGAAYQDIGFVQQTLCLAQRAMYIDESFYRYRLNREGASTKKNEVVQFVYQEFTRLLDGEVFPKNMDRQVWKSVFYRLSMCFGCEYDKVLRIQDYQTNSVFLSQYYEWFKQRMQEAMAEGVFEFSVLEKSCKFELRLLLKSADSYADYKCIRDSVEREPIEQLTAKIQNRPIVIFGCGKYGKELCVALDAQGVEIVAFYDNNEKLWGTEFGGIKIQKPEKQDNEDIVYLVAVKKYGEEIRKQLETLGISCIVQV